MSILQMVEVWRHRFSHPQQVVMLALADHANDFGSSIFPAVDYLAWKTEYSRRTVQNILGDLRACGILEVVKEATWNRPNEYRINWKKATLKKPYVRGAAFAPHQTGGAAPVQEGCSSGAEGCSSGALGVQPVAPEPSLTINRTVKEPSSNIVSKKTETAKKLFDLYNLEKPSAWSTARKLTPDRKKKLEAFASQHGEEAIEIFRAALVFVRSDNWWSARNFELEVMFTKNHALVWAEKSLSPQVMHGLSDADMRVAKTAHDIYSAIGGFDDVG